MLPPQVEWILEDWGFCDMGDWVGWTGKQSQMLALKKALFGHLYINVIYF